MNLVGQNTVATSPTIRRFPLRGALVALAMSGAIITAGFAWATFGPSAPGSEVASDRVAPGALLTAPSVVEFRRGERASGAQAGHIPGSLTDPAIVDFRRDERASGGTQDGHVPGSLTDPTMVEFRRDER
jgi:hypothetical protein